MFPLREEQAQVDVRPEHEAHEALGLDALVAAVALVHAPVVAREGHHLAQRADLLEDRLGEAGQGHRRGAAVGRHELGLGGAEAPRAVTHAEFGFCGHEGVVAFTQGGEG